MIDYPRLIAHRCGGALAPENTLAGLMIAAQLGCRAAEFDVMLTQDGVPILMHDETLERTTGLPGVVAQTPFATIRSAAPDVPTLAEAIDACQRLDLWANIELKPATGHEEETGAVVGAWLASHWNGEGVISSFSKKSTLAARHALPEAPFALLYETLPEDWQDDRAQTGAMVIHLDGYAVSEVTARRLNAAGMPWACYTIDTLDVADRLFGLGCAAVLTDRPDVLSDLDPSQRHD